MWTFSITNFNFLILIFPITTFVTYKYVIASYRDQEELLQTPLLPHKELDYPSFVSLSPPPLTPKEVIYICLHMAFIKAFSLTTPLPQSMLCVA